MAACSFLPRGLVWFRLIRFVIKIDLIRLHVVGYCQTIVRGNCPPLASHLTFLIGWIDQICRGGSAVHHYQLVRRFRLSGFRHGKTWYLFYSLLLFVRPFFVIVRAPPNVPEINHLELNQYHLLRIEVLRDFALFSLFHREPFNSSIFHRSFPFFLCILLIET